MSSRWHECGMLSVFESVFVSGRSGSYFQTGTTFKKTQKKKEFEWVWSPYDLNSILWAQEILRLTIYSQACILAQSLCMLISSV